MMHDLPLRSMARSGARWLGFPFGALTVLAGATADAQDPRAPPPGKVLFLSATGGGTQDYVCAAGTTAGAPAFRSTGPQSALSVPLAGSLTLELADNILAAVPGRAATAGPGCVEAADGIRQYCPAWRSPLDQSAVYGTTVASVAAGTGPSCPNAGAVPCLLLRALANVPGRGAPSLFGAVTYIQRLDTVGGLAPATACMPGRIEQVPYRATYDFYVSRR